MPECGLCMSGWNNPFSLPPPGGGKGPARGIFALKMFPEQGRRESSLLSLSVTRRAASLLRCRRR